MEDSNKQRSILVLIVVALVSCLLPLGVRSISRSELWQAPTWAPNNGEAPFSSAQTTAVIPSQIPMIIQSPTPGIPRPVPTYSADIPTYTVQVNDSIYSIAQSYTVDPQLLMQINQVSNPYQLYPGQVLALPTSAPPPPGPDFKIIPDSELVYSPSNVGFNIEAFINQHRGYLSTYQEEVDGEMVSGTVIVSRVAQEFSVNPRLLLAVLEYRSGWVTKTAPPIEFNQYPVGYFEQWHVGLYRQLSWAADNLNRGYYNANHYSAWRLADGILFTISPTINPGTVGVQHLFGLMLGKEEWLKAVSEHGFIDLYTQLFGYPFNFAFEPLVPDNLTQPALLLPFETGTTWSFTGGPHGGWGDGSAWAALDFAPPGEPQGCVISSAWATALADGHIVYSAHGTIILDLDNDGFGQTGWSIVYLHIDSNARVAKGSIVRAGDKIGHPSCEGGVSNSTHVHVARRYNGEWMPAGGPVPFSMEGWIAKSTGTEYDGFLVRNDQTIEAWNSFRSENQITR